MKELLESVVKDDLINANSLFNEALKKKIKDKLDQKKKEVMEPVHVDSFDVKDDHENIHEAGGFPGLNHDKAIGMLKKVGYLKDRDSGGHTIMIHPTGKRRIAIPHHKGDLSMKVGGEVQDALKNITPNNKYNKRSFA